jgi:hypothetical protein
MQVKIKRNVYFIYTKAFNSFVDVCFIILLFYFISLSSPAQAANSNLSVTSYPINEASVAVPINGVIKVPEYID